MIENEVVKSTDIHSPSISVLILFTYTTSNLLFMLDIIGPFSLLG